MSLRASPLVLVAALAAMLLIAALSYGTYRSIETLNEAGGRVTHTERVRLQLERVISTLKDAETGVRGYLLNRDASFLEPYRASLERIGPDIARLRALIADNPQQVANTEKLDEAAARLIRSLARSLRERTANPSSDFSLLAQQGQRRMDETRAVVRVLQNEENRLLALRMETIREARFSAYATALATGLLGIALIALLIHVSSREAARLRASEQWLGTTLTSIGDAVIATDSRGCVRFLNPVASELTGWSTSDAHGKPLAEVFNIINEDTRARVESPVTTVLREGHVVGLANHTLLIRRDGQETPIEDSGSPIKTEDGEIEGVVLVFKDASAPRDAERRLRESEARFRRMADDAPVMVWLANTEGRCTYLSRSWYEFTGAEPESGLGTGWLEAVHPDDAAAAPRRIATARSTKSSFTLDYRVRHRDGQYRWVVNSAVPRFGEEGEFVGYIGSILDVDERRKLEDRLRQSQKLDALGTLAGGIAHDFNNILGILTGCIDVAREEAAPEHPVQVTLTSISKATTRAKHLVRQILTFARQQDPSRAILDPVVPVREAVDMLRSTLPVKIDIRVGIPERLPSILADPSQLQQVITNLAINASQAIGDAAGTVTIELDAVNVDGDMTRTSPDLHEGTYVRLKLSDTGHGMTPEVQDRIFEPFFTTKQTGAGTGLGLSVVQGIVRSHDGAISVYSQPGKGTRFHVYFPSVAAAAAAAQSEPGALRVIPRGQGEHVLFVDDEPTFGHLATLLLNRLGYRVTVQNDAKAAAAMFEAAPAKFDAVITDLSMPGMNGIELARRLLKKRPDIPIVLATGYVRAEDVDRALAAGIREVLLKPATAEEMSRVLQKTLA